MLGHAGLRDVERGACALHWIMPGPLSPGIAHPHPAVKVFWRWAFEADTNEPGVVDVMKGTRPAVEARARRKIINEYTDVAPVVIVGIEEVA
jgi:hypothetical protein